MNDFWKALHGKAMSQFPASGYLRVETHAKMYGSRKRKERGNESLLNKASHIW